LFKVFQAHTDRFTQSGKEPQMIILGIVLVVVGLVAGIPILETIGVILLVIGAILWVLGSIGSRRRRSQALLLTGGLTILTDASYGGRGRSSNLPPHAIDGPDEMGAL